MFFCKTVSTMLLRYNSLASLANNCKNGGQRATNVDQVKSFGSLSMLTKNVREFVEEKIALCQPDNVHICTGSPLENDNLLNLMKEQGVIEPLPKYKNCYLARTNPKDVARVESKTFICTKEKYETVPHTKDGVKCSLGNWISYQDYNKAVQERFPNCMKGRTMYVIPFSMGPVGGPLSKVGIEITDSPYVVASMRIMTRIGTPVLNFLNETNGDFVKCLHSVGSPASGVHERDSWPCDPDRTIILHKPDENEIISYGSGYGGNSLLGKKCFALRIGSTIAKKEGWLAEHMLILGITNPQGVKKYIAAAFPSACGKTNLAMLTPTIPGYKVECVGDDICWMRFDEKGKLRAINPEAGFFGVAPGTSYKTNPNAMNTIFENSIFTNVAKTDDGGVYWEGMDNIPKEATDWMGKPWRDDCGRPAAHPNSRFCSPCGQCPIIDTEWENPQGVEISAILFGGRRPEENGVPLVYEAFDWQHGVFIGAGMRSESTAAAEHKGKVIMHDPFAMRPFLGYNFGNYLKHWLSMSQKADKHLPKIFHVNWFRKENGKFLWPGFGENCRILDWILRRIDGEESIAKQTPIGYIPENGSLNLEGIKDQVDQDKLFSLSKTFWLKECSDLRKYFDEQVGSDLPDEISKELEKLLERVNSMPTDR